jgi:hypothetical protein
MQKKRIKISGIGLIPVIAVIVIAAVVAVIVVDVTRTAPATPQETCTLVDHIVLPDNCVCSVAGRTCTATATRPYLFFFTEATACPTLGCDVDLRNQ